MTGAGNEPGAQCTRYRRNGERCTETTTAADGWCRTAGCPGYVRPAPVAPDDDDLPNRAPRGTRRHVAQTGDLPVALDIDEIPDVRVSQRARDAFRFHHRGTDEGAQVQLLGMLEDFLVRSARRVSATGYIELAREGYELVLSPDAGVVVGYRTVHKERTWEQVKAGVPSRYRKNRHRTSRETRPEQGPSLPPQDLAVSVDPATVHLTSLVRSKYCALRGLDADDDGLDTALRAEFGARLRHLQVGARVVDVLADLVDDELTWTLSRDARTLICVRPRREGDLAALPGTSAAGDE